MKKVFGVLIGFLILIQNIAGLAAEEVGLFTFRTNEIKLYQEGWLGEIDEQVSLSNVSDTETVKKQIVKSMLNLEDTVDISSYKIHVSVINELMHEVLNENPDIFFIELGDCSYSYNRFSENVTMLDFSKAYRYSKDIIKEKQRIIENEVNAILEIIDFEKMNDAEKALAVHDWFVLHYGYDYHNYCNGTVPEKSYRMDGLFIDKIAVCQGYALGYMYVMNKIGIETIFVTSNLLNHGWNMLKIEEDWYHVDVTWDDPTAVNVGDLPGSVLHNNFLISDEELIETGHDSEENPKNNPSEIWNSPYTAPETYIGFWKDVNCAISYKDGQWFYFRDDSIIKRQGETEKKLLLISDLWHKKGTSSVYVDKFCSVAVFKDRLYYNTSEEIRSVKLDGTEDALLEEVSLLGNDLYGIYIEDDLLHYIYAESPSGERTISEGIFLGFSFNAKIKNQTLQITTGGHVLSGSRLFVAMYKGEELVSIDIIPIIAGKKEYESTLPNIEGNAIRVFAFSGMMPKEHALTLR